METIYFPLHQPYYNEYQNIRTQVSMSPSLSQVRENLFMFFAQAIYRFIKTFLLNISALHVNLLES